MSSEITKEAVIEYLKDWGIQIGSVIKRYGYPALVVGIDTNELLVLAKVDEESILLLDLYMHPVIRNARLVVEMPECFREILVS